MPSKSLKLTADIVNAYVGNNHVPIEQLSTVMKDVHAALVGLEQLRPLQQAPSSLKHQPKPVPARESSVTDEYIISFENGKRYRTLSMHLKALGLTPSQYRSKWHLPSDYPIIAPAYSKKRSILAKRIGLGKRSGA